MDKKRLITPIEAGFTEEMFDDPAILEQMATPFVQWLLWLSARKMSNRNSQETPSKS